MRVCDILSALYGKDTRSAQTLNVVVAAWWGFVMCPGSEWLSILRLPTALLRHPLVRNHKTLHDRPGETDNQGLLLALWHHAYNGGSQRVRGQVPSHRRDDGS